MIKYDVLLMDIWWLDWWIYIDNFSIIYVNNFIIL